MLTFQLFFEKDSKQNSYALMYYDLSLQKETALSDLIINGINTTNTEKSMAEIDWKTAFDFRTKKLVNFEDKTSWENELKVESVIESLSELQKSEDWKGYFYRAETKILGWYFIPGVVWEYQSLKNKSEGSQRFLFF